MSNEQRNLIKCYVSERRAASRGDMPEACAMAERFDWWRDELDMHPLEAESFCSDFMRRNPLGGVGL